MSLERFRSIMNICNILFEWKYEVFGYEVSLFAELAFLLACSLVLWAIMKIHEHEG